MLCKFCTVTTDFVFKAQAGMEFQCHDGVCENLLLTICKDLQGPALTALASIFEQSATENNCLLCY